MAISAATQEVASMAQKVIVRFEFISTKSSQTYQGAIENAKNPVAHARTKHIDIRYHYVHKAVNEGIVELFYCPTDVMIADVLTKPLSRGRFVALRDSMNMETPSTKPYN